MSPILQALGIDRLSTEEKVRLIGEIWDSIPDSSDQFGIPEFHREELDRRLAVCEADPQAGSIWEEVKKRLRKDG
jgi:putative addiction module component (TIGR02574 family)